MTFHGLDQDRVTRALDEALARALQQEKEEGPTVLDLFHDQVIIFSDQHKGARNGADDFQVAEGSYSAALNYYYRMGYTLLTLGDVEELWEERPRPVIDAYETIFDLEARFHQEGRYLRIWGNHDDNWRYPEEVKKHLVPVYGGQALKVREVLLMRVMDGGQKLGDLLLLHGHHGTLDSDYFRDFSRQIIRYIWRPFQRFTRIPSNTPATDWQLRHGHNVALYHWTENKKQMLLVAGHTHRPVFKSLTNQAQIEKELAFIRQKAAAEPADKQLQAILGDLLSELAWVKEQQAPRRPGTATSGQPDQKVTQRKPSYFNSGCCCYPDGDITGIELVGGEIRLVRWSPGGSQPQRQVLERAALRDVFARL